jgi:hypothetical protein
MLLDQPFTRTAQLQAGAVHQQMKRVAVSIIVSAAAGTGSWYLHRLGSPAERGEGGHCQAQSLFD